MSSQASEKVESAIFGGGCFWCVEAVFQSLPGVVSVTSGYAGGTTENPSYEEVTSGRTGHAEVVQIEFDSDQISYPTLLEWFWKAHDPTTLNRQGADVGTQYRSIILVADETQRSQAGEAKRSAQANFKNPIVTEIASLEKFYPAEDYHQDFYLNNPTHPYNRAVIRPKLEKLGKE